MSTFEVSLLYIHTTHVYQKLHMMTIFTCDNVESNRKTDKIHIDLVEKTQGIDTLWLSPMGRNERNKYTFLFTAFKQQRSLPFVLRLRYYILSYEIAHSITICQEKKGLDSSFVNNLGNFNKIISFEHRSGYRSQKRKWEVQIKKDESTRKSRVPPQNSSFLIKWIIC